MQINRRGKFLVNQLYIKAGKSDRASLGGKRRIGAPALDRALSRRSCAFEQTSAPQHDHWICHIVSASRLLQWVETMKIRHAPRRQQQRLRPSDCLAINQIEQSIREFAFQGSRLIFIYCSAATPTTWPMWSICASERVLITHSQCSTTHLTSHIQRARAQTTVAWASVCFIINIYT